jgi:hypothetical protein
MVRVAVVIFFFFCLPFLGVAQVLESYAGDWKSATEQSLLGIKSQKELTISVATFPGSSFRFEVPGNSTLFIEGKLWELILQDTSFFISSKDLRNDFGKDSLLVTVINDRVRLGDFDLKITKEAKRVGVDEKKLLAATGFVEARRVMAQPLKDFYGLSLLLIFALTAVYRLVYPYLLGVLLQPLSVIKAEDFSESGGLQKVFSIDILFFLLIVGMMLAQCLVTGIVLFRPDWIVGWIGESALSLLFFWVLASFALLVLTVLKFSAIKLVSYLFDLGKSEFAHFFYLLRLIAFGFAAVLVVVTFFVINDFNGLKSAYTFVMKSFFWVYVVGVMGLFLLMVNRLDFKKYHLFTYLCIAEIVPFLILCKWIMVLAQ